jgi:HK97 family phage major capsid protein
MLDSLRESRATAAADAAALLAGEVTTEALDAAEARHAEIKDLDSKIETAEALEARTAELKEVRAAANVPTFGPAVVTREAMTYDKGSNNSFYRDMINANVRNDSDAWARLARHQSEVAVETRDTTRVDGSGGDFVPPLYLINEFAEFARAASVTRNLATAMALPAGTDSINIPAITTGTRTGFQAADASSTYAPTSPRDLTTATVTAPVRTISGFLNVSIQLLEQSPIAAGLDRLVFGDLIADQALQLNTAIAGNGDGTSGGLRGYTNLGTDSTNGVVTTWTEATPSVTGFIGALSKAISGVVTNRYRDVTGIVMSPSTWYWLTAQVDGQSRPIIVPTAAGPFNAQGINAMPGGAAGLAGAIMGVPVYLDATLKNAVGTNQSPILVGKFDDSYLFSGGTKTRVLPDVLSASLSVRLQSYEYVAFAHRFNKAVTAITGTGTVTPSGY